MSNMRQKDLRPAPALIEFKGMKFLITDRPSDVTIHHYITELKKNNVSTVVRVCEPSYNTDELEAQGITVKDLAFEDGTFPPPQVVDEWFEILKQKFSNNHTTAPSSSTTPSTLRSASVSFYRNKRFSLKNKHRNDYENLDNCNAMNHNANDDDDIDMATGDTNANNANNDECDNNDNENTTCRYQQNPEACVAVHCVAGLGRAPVLVALALIELGLKYEAAVEMIRDKRRGAINAKQLSFLERYKPKARLKHKNGHKNSCCVQ
ncbi:PREDICTED: protein tyrosine phosphatase type IVA 1 isoform X1 [Rhagoletis zephyria]|uniref:protein tyrosine phosphatase type IVA 1 isoform X1 n=1 Tax=Rhagoletis zephyria TaxID=28612 RepID=UPI0008117BE7|nr:PREDICTED: protein tyrosine phosphatase type IVA 1 isoform X1 [Rhagoletis zephyria]XP_017478948.1 PREDICTED: protein tyrosine phosphatase type IVA 1 isoform X1 [Rhagoletis zephyria]XP_017478954.1 PREDICTED: protein tyrosine phosphatase type IVA 1 isoform X1 [Rhagoletis zephyria]XP_017478962.1 PREDICTED: protein tyrosine phosphatase type IVA 1 isoform X1 [Rhagoletis zephyria]XP_017478967.1 PREDICTED: protein tyrosine phosphatase type IVA 1 isoform X1 [Rhagoletis zephyria]XP_017478977.1 PREDI